MSSPKRIMFHASAVIGLGFWALVSGPTTVSAVYPDCNTCVTNLDVCEDQELANQECLNYCEPAVEAVACVYYEPCIMEASLECEIP
jgi:hypothetical protein